MSCMIGIPPAKTKNSYPYCDNQSNPAAYYGIDDHPDQPSQSAANTTKNRAERNVV